MNIKSIEEFTIEDCRSFLLQDSDSEIGKMVLAHLLKLLERGAPISTSPQPPKTQPYNGVCNGHEWVDLGLSVKWATCNIGASSPEKYGDYFAWGETSTKSSYTEVNSKTYNRDMGSIAGNSSYDAARAKWGSSWRLPTKTELEELKNRCTWTWTTQGGHRGYKVTGPNGNFIFLPAAGSRCGGSLLIAGEYGGYWSATPYGSRNAYGLFFYNDFHDVGWLYRFYGYSVRPVLE